MQKSVVFLLSIVLITLLPVVAGTRDSVQPLTAGDLNELLNERHAGWVAADNWITRLDPDERRLLLGLPDLIDKMSTDQLKAVDSGETRRYSNGFDRVYKDWRDYQGHNWVTSIKNQGQCGSCVAFGTIAAIESRLRIVSGIWDFPIDLSEQHLFSCGGGSCSSGWQISSAYSRCVNPGVPDDECLPYTASDSNCASGCSDWRARAYKIQDYEQLGNWFWPPTDAQIKEALSDGPVTVSMVVYEDFYSYSEGVYQHTTGGLEGGHAVCIVGYDDSLSCWIVKNSWGRNWGEDGFFRIIFGDSDIGHETAYPIITNIPPTPTPEPSTPTPPPTPTSIPSQTPIPSSTPIPSPTSPDDPTPTPDPNSGNPRLDLQLNQPDYHAGDTLKLALNLINPGPSFEIDLYVILDFQGGYWFWPSWTEAVECRELEMPDQREATLDLLEFQWPELTVNIEGAVFWAGGLHGRQLTAGYDYEVFTYFR